MDDPFYEPATGRTFATVDGFRLAYPNTSFGDLASEDERNAFGLHRILDVRPPHDQRTQVLVETGHAVIGGLLHRQWRIDPAPAAHLRAVAKAEREMAVAAIKVTTQAGNTFDGDETSQGRMARAIVALQGTGAMSVAWVLADNTAIEASAAELTEALALAGAAQASLWVLP